MIKSDTTFTIGQTAQLTGLSAKMIRDYERHGLLGDVSRSESGYRLFNQQDLQTLHFISHARQLGFSLAQLQDLLQLWHNKSRSSAEVKKLALQHIQQLEQRANTLLAMAATLKDLSERCHGDERPDCPILKGLESIPSSPDISD